MSSELRGTPRAGKYCPRCQSMMPQDQMVCRRCGHEFRTGADGAKSEAALRQEEKAGPDPLHRTMQFILPPLPLQTAAPAKPPLIPRRTLSASRPFLFAALVALLCVGAGLAWHARAGFAPPSPAGTWEAALHGKALANAHLEFAFRPDGSGRFSWREPGSPSQSGETPAQSGETPLRWHQNADKTLTLNLMAPPKSDQVSRTLSGIFGGHSWPWRIDGHPRRLLLGALTFTEKP